MEFIYQHKWQLLLLLETFSYVITFLVFFSRYWLESEALFRFFVSFEILTGWVPDIILAIIDYVKTQQVGPFICFVFIFLIYCLIWGKKHIEKLDAAAKKWCIKRKREKELLQVHTQRTISTFSFFCIYGIRKVHNLKNLSLTMRLKNKEQVSVHNEKRIVINKDTVA
jgi:hypothetical protein